MEPVVYLDLDGVLVDFVSGALAAHGKSLPRKETTWDFPRQIGFDDTWAPECWSKFGHDFWANLDWMPEGRTVLAMVEAHFKERVVLMTSPCETPGGVEGKAAWIRKHLPAYRKRFLIGPTKHLAAGPTKLLIDDHEANVDAFTAHGGRALLVPRPWNHRRDLTDAEGCFDPAALEMELVALHQSMRAQGGAA